MAELNQIQQSHKQLRSDLEQTMAQLQQSEERFQYTESQLQNTQMMKVVCRIIVLCFCLCSYQQMGVVR